MAVESRHRTKEELGLPPSVVLADDLQKALEKYFAAKFIQSRKTENIDLEKIRKRANLATNNLVKFLRENLGPNHSDFVRDEANNEYWYITKEAVDRVVSAEKPRNLVLGGVYDTAGTITSDQFKAIKLVLESMGFGKPD